MKQEMMGWQRHQLDHMLNKSSAVAQMGDRLATTDMD